VPKDVVEGTFTASGGARKDVEVYLLNDDEFVTGRMALPLIPCTTADA
jgi:hypothetical protein